jgi:DNA integrity scanning protein DisA with diadenylate cyclase activity
MIKEKKEMNTHVWTETENKRSWEAGERKWAYAQIEKRMEVMTLWHKTLWDEARENNQRDTFLVKLNQEIVCLERSKKCLNTILTNSRVKLSWQKLHTYLEVQWKTHIVNINKSFLKKITGVLWIYIKKNINVFWEA